MILEYNDALMHTPAFLQALNSCIQQSSTLAAQYGKRNDDRYAFLWLPEAYTERIDEAQIYATISSYRPDIILIIGIGGSSMGTLALYTMTRHTLPEHAPELWFATTVDAITTQTLSDKIVTACRKGKRIATIIISKSGNTLETRVNAAIYIELLKKHATLQHGQITVITDRQSPLWNYAHENGWLCLTTPALLGGRFSVWSSISTLPLALTGLSIPELLRGAQQATTALCTTATHHAAAYLATFRSYYYGQGWRVHDSCLSAPHLYPYGGWLRQLIGESLGKYRGHTTPPEAAGFLPTISVLTDDLHSVFQQYMAGPRTSITTFIQDRAEERTITVPVESSLAESSYQGLSAAQLNHTILQAAQQAYRQAELPYVSLSIDSRTLADIGMLMQCEMIATILLGQWGLAIDPFGQPEVERYKTIMKHLLGIQR